MVDAYRLHQGMALVPPWTGFWEALRLMVTQGDMLLAMKVAALILFAVLILRRDTCLEDKLFGLAVILQNADVHGGDRFWGPCDTCCSFHPAFMVLGGYARRQKSQPFIFYLVALEVLNLSWMWAFLNWSLVL